MPYIRYLCLFCSSLPTVICRRDHALLRYLCLFCSSLPTVVCRRDHALFTLFVFDHALFT